LREVDGSRTSDRPDTSVRPLVTPLERDGVFRAWSDGEVARQIEDGGSLSGRGRGDIPFVLGTEGIVVCPIFRVMRKWENAAAR
jgi:hypothetical protein